MNPEQWDAFCWAQIAILFLLVLVPFYRFLWLVVSALVEYEDDDEAWMVCDVCGTDDFKARLRSKGVRSEAEIREDEARP